MCAKEAVGLQALTNAVADCWVRHSWTRVQRSFAARASFQPRPARVMRWPKPSAQGRTLWLDAAAVCLTDALQACMI